MHFKIYSSINGDLFVSEQSSETKRLPPFLNGVVPFFSCILSCCFQNILGYFLYFINIVYKIQEPYSTL
jgi:hypothetical protein